jgi:hypothetical protein
MSWSESFTDVSYGDLAALNPVNRVDPEQFKAAVNAVKAIMESDSTGDHTSSDVRWHLHVNGHVNENHEPPEGWTPDAVSIAVYRTNRNDPN